MHVDDLRSDDEEAIQQVAAILVEGFATNWPDAWPDMEWALEEVRESFADGRISRVARSEDGTVLGWVGGISQYRGRVWELHPLAVRTDRQGSGIGRMLVADLEEQVRERGGLTITLGTDDQNEQTSLSGVDLYPEIWWHVAQITNWKRHPFEFYQKQGYVIVGVIPDANGLGKPDILMAKSLVR
jgi:aminoglycoside 6'-N-acetyltransferase I